MATDAATLAEEVLAFTHHPADVVRHEDHVRSVANLAAGFVVLRGENGPEPVFVIAVSFLDARRGSPISLMTRGAAEPFRIVNLQQVRLGMARESPRVLVRLFAWQGHGSGSELDRLASAKMARLATVDNLCGVFPLQICGVLVDVDLTHGIAERFHAILQALQLRSGKTHHV